MYSLVKAVGIKLEGNRQWAEIPVADMTFLDVYKQHRRVIFTLSNPVLTNNVALDFESIRDIAGTSPLTVSEWLVANGNKALPTVDRLPDPKPHWVLYQNGFRSGYKITPSHPDYGSDTEHPDSEKTALLLTKIGTDMTKFQKHVMVSVNGYFHRVDADTKRAWVYDGNRTGRFANLNAIGMHSFEQIGDIQYVPITPAMIFKQRADIPLSEKAYVDIGVDCADKTILLVIGGYLSVLDKNTYYRVSDEQIAIDFRNYPLIDRILESQPFLDLSDLPIVKKADSPTTLSVKNIYSDEFITAYLTMSQSFIVLVDNIDMFVEQVKLRRLRSHRTVLAYQKPVFPLITGLGKMAEYWSTKGVGNWALHLYDNQYHNRTFYTTGLTETDAVNGANQPLEPQWPSATYFLKIGSDI
jgi:hypothetical protein